MLNCDYLIIGAGQTGLITALTLAETGKEVILVEQGEPGGAYLYSYEIPKKLLTNYAREFSDSLKIFKDHPDTFMVLRKYRQKINQKISAQISNYREKINKSLSLSKNLHLVRGVAEFTSKTLVEVNSDTERHLISFKEVVLAVGKNTIVPPNINGLIDINFLHKHNAFTLQDIPSTLSIIGITAENLEVADIYANLGVKVSFFEQKESISGIKYLDKSTYNYLIKKLLAKQVEFNFKQKISKVSQETGQVILENQNKKKFKSSHLFVSIKEIFQDDALHLQKIGINYLPRGVLVGHKYNTQQKYVYALGECNGNINHLNKFAVTYTFLEKMKYAHNLSNSNNHIGKVTNGFFPGIYNAEIYPLQTQYVKIETENPVMTVGLTETEAVSQYGSDIKIEIIDSSIFEGFAKLVIRQNSDQIIGMSLAGDFYSKLESYAIRNMQKALAYKEFRYFIKSWLGV